MAREIQNPLVHLTLKSAKERGLYKGPLVQAGAPGYHWAPKSVKQVTRVDSYFYLRKIRGRKKRKRVYVPAYEKTVTYYFKVPVKHKKEVRSKAWINCQTYMRRMRHEYEVESMDLIYHTDMAKDVVSPIDAFVWTKPLRYKKMIRPGSPDYIIPKPKWRGIMRTLYRAARVWFLLFDKRHDIFMIGSRAAKFPFAQRSYKEAHAEVDKIKTAVREYYEAEANSEYFELQGFVAFSVYRGWEKMPYLKHKGRKRRKRR